MNFQPYFRSHAQNQQVFLPADFALPPCKYYRFGKRNVEEQSVPEIMQILRKEPEISPPVVSITKSIATL